MKRAGLTREQAAAIAEAQREVFSEALDTTLATKRDIDRLEAKMDKHNWMIGILIGLAVVTFAKQFF